MTPGDFDALFDDFHRTVVRLETLPSYDVGGDETELQRAHREHLPRPERSVRTDPWLARIAVSTVTGHKVWERVRVVDDPLTDYQSLQLEAYKESQACGEQIHVACRPTVASLISGVDDFWLYDAGLPTQLAVTMRYGPTGRWLGAEKVTDPAVIARLARICEQVQARARPLNEFLVAAHA